MNQRISWLWNPFLSIFTHRKILARTTSNDFRQRYAGSLLGMAWVVLAPMFLLGLYSMIYLVVFQIRAPNMGRLDYVLYIFSGLVPFLSFAESLSLGATSLSVDKDILLNTVFPSELVPFRTILVGQGTLIAGMSMVLTAAAVLGHITPWTLLVPVIWLMMMMFLAGVVWVLSLANLVLQDIEQILRFVTIALMITTPIAYTTDMVPSQMKIIIFANPLSYYVISFQHLILLGKPPPGFILPVAIGFSFFSFCFGFFFYQRVKKVFF